MRAEKKLSDLEVGDKICVIDHVGFGRDRFQLNVGVIERVTATQITALGARWTKSGRKVGQSSSWDPQFLTVWTSELQAEADQHGVIIRAERVCHDAGSRIGWLRGNDAVRMAALLPAELTGVQP